ncbi:MAG: 4Fe-4S ferredoxin-type domain-containing protein [Succiniclasticum sp.]
MARIFYFSGTGNSLAIAKGLAKRLNARVCSIPAYLDKPYAISDEVVGVVSPVHCTELPPIVEKFFRRFQVRDSVQYLFTVVDAGSITGDALGEAGNLIARRRFPRLEMTAGYEILLPDGSILFSTPSKKQKEMLDALDTELDRIARDVSDRIHREDHLTRNPLWMAGKKMGWPILDGFFRVKERGVDPARCVGCGTCVQVCPVQCITMEHKLPVFGDGCVSCFGCAQWCPKQAISLGRLRPKAGKQYHNPLVTASEMEEAKRQG